MRIITPITEVIGKDIAKSASRRFTGWLGRTSSGERSVRRSQWESDLEYDEAADKYADIGELHAPNHEFEEEERAKIGPWSLQSTWEERKQLESYQLLFSDRTWKPDKRALSRALDACFSHVRKLNPLTLAQSVERSPKKKLSGLPWWVSDDSKLEWYTEEAEHILNGEDLPYRPDIAGWRGVGRNRRETAQRLLMMASKENVLVGGRYVPVVTEALKSKEQFAAWNHLDVVDDVVTKLLIRARDRGVPVWSTDYSAFDATVPKEALDFYSEWLSAFFSPSEAGAIKWVVNGMATSALLTPDGVIETNPGGIRSGWLTTNNGGTFVNLLVSHYIAEALGVQLVGGTYLGDDALNVYDPSPDADEVSDAASDLNLRVHPDKQFVDLTRAHYLQRVHSLDYLVNGKAVGVRPIMRGINGMLNFERFHPDWNRWMMSARTLQQLFNFKNHPGFDIFVDRAKSGDSTLQKFSPAEIYRRAGGIAAVEAATGRDAFGHTTFSGEEVISGFNELL